MAKRKPIFVQDAAEAGLVSLSFYDPAIAKDILDTIASQPADGPRSSLPAFVPPHIAFLMLNPPRQKSPWVTLERSHLSDRDFGVFNDMMRLTASRPVAEGPARISISPEANDNWDVYLGYAEKGQVAQLDVTHLLPEQLEGRIIKAGITHATLHCTPGQAPQAIGLQALLTDDTRTHNFVMRRRPGDALAPWTCNDSEELVRGFLETRGPDDRSVIYDPRVVTPAMLQNFFTASAVHMAATNARHLPPAPGADLPVTWKV